MPNNVKRAAQYKRTITYEQIHYHLNSMLAQIMLRSSVQEVVIYGIPRGGLIPATVLSHAVACHRPARLVTSLDHLNPSDWHRLVIVDELVDSGDTIKSIKKRFPEALTVAVFQRANAEFGADLVGEIVQSDDWLEFPWETL